MAARRKQYRGVVTVALQHWSPPAFTYHVVGQQHGHVWGLPLGSLGVPVNHGGQYLVTVEVIKRGRPAKRRK